MLWTLFVILLVLWLFGFIVLHVLGAFIHILLAVAILVLIFAFIDRRRATH